MSGALSNGGGACSLMQGGVSRCVAPPVHRRSRGVAFPLS